jgi:hypothetical protein
MTHLHLLHGAVVAVCICQYGESGEHARNVTRLAGARLVNKEHIEPGHKKILAHFCRLNN